MQLSRSYVIANADSSSKGIIWNIETSLRKTLPWKVLEDQKQKIFSENDVEKILATLMESEIELFLF